MVQIKVVVGGMVQALTAVQAIGAAGKAVTGPLASFGSLLPYSYGIETGRHRGGRLARAAGGAQMVAKGTADASAFARTILPAAILKGTASVGQAKRQIRDKGIERIRVYTPVRSGKLRDSVKELTRPG